MSSSVLRIPARLAIISVLAAWPAAADDVAAFDHVSCKGSPNEIKVTINEVSDSVGLMTAELYRNDAENFLKKGGREFRVRYAANAPFTQFCLTAPGPGVYAVVVYHDENANRKFDKTTFGLPAEPFGISNDPAIRLGPPPIEKALFEVASDGASVEINLRD